MNNTTSNSIFDPIQVETFHLVLVLCAIIFFGALIFFSCLRLHLSKIYIPRRLLIDNGPTKYVASKRKYWGWILEAFKNSDDDVYISAGLDALVFLRFFKLTLKIAVMTLPYGVIVLIPINYYGGNKLPDTLDKLSLSNVTAGKASIWAHFIPVWLYTFAIFYLSYQEWNVYVKYRQKYLRKGAGNQFAVLVRGLPNEVDSETSLKQDLDDLFRNKIACVHILRKLTTWAKLVEKHDDFVIKYERAKEYHTRKQKNPEVSTYPFGPKQDALAYYESKLKVLQEKLEKEKGREGKESLNAALIIFKSLRASNQALQTVWTTSPFTYHKIPAPEPQEIIWRNLKVPLPIKKIRMLLGLGMVFWLVLFWTVPILFISSLTKLDWLANHLSFLNYIQEDASKILIAFIQGVIPTILMSLTQILLPEILFLITNFQGFVAKSRMSMTVFKYLFIFQAFNNFFIYIVSSSVLQDIQKIIEKPFDIPELLAKSLPSQSAFFINYIALMSFVGLAVEITRIVPMFVYFFRLKFLAKCQRERLNAWKPGRPTYESMFSTSLLFFLIGISFSVLSPVIIPFFVIYFGFGYVVWSYQLMNVYVPEWEHGGKFWPEVFYRLLASVCVFQLLMMGVFFFKSMWYCGAFITPLFVLTIAYWWYMASQFGEASKHLVLKEASTVQHADQAFLENVRNEYIRDYYLPGIFEVSTDRKRLPFEPWPSQAVESSLNQSRCNEHIELTDAFF